MILKFPVWQKMHNGSLGAGEFGSKNSHGSKQLLRANLRRPYIYKRNEMFFLYAAENAESEPIGQLAHLSLFAKDKEKNDVLLY